MQKTAAILCEIIADTALRVATLAEIAGTCGRDVGQKLIVKTTVAKRHQSAETVLTLHLPVELAASQHQVWCLACRLACFCPDARVSVLVQGAFAEQKVEPAKGRRRSA